VVIVIGLMTNHRWVCIGTPCRPTVHGDDVVLVADAVAENPVESVSDVVAGLRDHRR